MWGVSTRVVRCRVPGSGRQRGVPTHSERVVPDVCYGVSGAVRGGWSRPGVGSGKSGVVTGCGCGQKSRFVAIDRATGECVVRDETGACVEFAAPGEAVTAAAGLGVRSPGVRRVRVA